MTTIGKRCSKSGPNLIHRSIQDGTLEPRFNKGHVELLVIEPWGTDGLRVRATISDDLTNDDWALSEPIHNPISNIIITDTEAIIRNGNISARISDTRVQQAHIEIYRHTEDGEKEVILSEKHYVVNAHNPGTRTYKTSDNDLYETELHFEPKISERFYGMGLNDTGTVNLKGCIIDMYQRHVKHVVPFVVSTEGYGFLWNNPSLGRAEFGNNLTRWVSEGCKQIDYYITASENYHDILANYANVSGHAPEFPYWASGFWQCKNRYVTQEEFLDVAREFKNRGLPLSVHVIDFLHWKKQGDWALDPKFWPNPESMVRELDEMGVRIMISPWTLIEDDSENFIPMRDRGLFTRSVNGKKDTVSFRQKDVHQYDPTNPEAAKYLWQKWKQNYFDLGIKTFWLDPCDDLHKIPDYPDVIFHIGSGTEVHNFFPIAHQKNIYEGLIDAGEPEVVTICRSSWAGSQKYGASPAAHDIESSFEHLESYMKAGLNLSMSGIPWGAAEIGGFVTDNDSTKEFQELMIRWYQYGVFTPVFRTHGKRPSNNNEPWNIGGDTYKHIRQCLLLREALRPYIMDQMELASSRGIPPMRPMFFDFPNQKELYDIEDQFLFGSDLLIAPILQYKTRERSVYLPSSCSWTNVWENNTVEGGNLINVKAPIDRIPVFVNASNNRLIQLFNSHTLKTISNFE